MSGKYRILALMTGAQAGAAIVQQAVGVLAPFLIVEFGLNKAGLGAMFTSLYLGSALFTALGGVLTDRFGERTMVGASGIIMVCALLASAAIPQYPWLVFTMGLFGVGYAAQTPAGGRAILSWFDSDRGFAMGVRQTGVPIGGFVGALVLPLAALHFGGYRAAMLVAAGLVTALTALAYCFYREAAGDRPPPSRFREVLAGMRRLARDPRLIAATLTCAALSIGQGALNGFLTVTAVQVVGVTPPFAATAFSSAFVAATVARLFWGWYSDQHMRASRLALLAVLCGFSAVASFAFALLRPALVPLLIPAAVFLGFFSAGWNGVMAAALAEIGGADRAGSALGLTLTAVFIASAAAPVAFGAIADRTSLDTAWIVIAAVGGLGVLPVLWLRAQDRRTKEQAA